jgi:YHS domain-containing protein
MTQANGHGENGVAQSGGPSGTPYAAQHRGEPTMTDPVCGKPVLLSSPHTLVFSGALFCFCSTECCAQFQLEPARFVRLEANTLPMARDDDAPTLPLSPPAAAPIPTQTPKRPPTLATSPTPMTNVISVFEEKHGSTIDTADDRALAMAATAQSAAAAGAALVPAQRVASNARVASVSASSPDWLTANHERGLLEQVRGLLATPLALWRQSRHAAAVSRQLLKLHSFVAERHPDLKGRALYRQIVMVRSGADIVSADRMLNRAEQSFAQWPAQRDLRFADVVHYLAVEEFLAAHGETHWTHAHMGRVVAARIPSKL